MDIILRDITLSDFDSISRLMNQVHSLHSQNRPDIYVSTDFPLSREEFSNLLSREPNISLLAQAGADVVGFCMVSLRPPSQNPVLVQRKVAYMDDLCVDAAYRGQGIGKRLFDETASRAKAWSVDSLELMVWSFNQPAVRFYESMGMTPRFVMMEFKP